MSEVPGWARDRFEREVVPALFTGAASSATPTLILIGGQPGAGKTWAMKSALASHPGESIVPIIGDDLRIHHPDYDGLMATDPMRMPEVTAKASAFWVEASLGYAREHHYGVLVEGTFRRPDVALDTAKQFHIAGYRVHVVAVAVPPWESRLSTLERFVIDHAAGRAARWTPVAAHDAGFVGTPITVAAAAASPDVQQLTVVDRSGTALFDADLDAPRGGAETALRKEHRRSFSRTEFVNWRSRLAWSRSYLEANVPTSEETRALLGVLQEDSAMLARNLGGASAVPAIPPSKPRGPSVG